MISQTRDFRQKLEILPNLSEDRQIHMESGIPNPRFYEVCLHFELKDQETGAAKSKHSGSQKSKNSRIYAIAWVCYRDTCGKWGGTPSLLPHIQKRPLNSRFYVICPKTSRIFWNVEAQTRDFTQPKVNKSYIFLTIPWIRTPKHEILYTLCEDRQISLEREIPNSRFYVVCLYFEFKDQGRNI